MLAPVLSGKVDDSGEKLTLASPETYRRHIRRYAGKHVEVVIRLRRSQRSLKQNAWLWGVAIPLLAEELGYDAHEHEALHYALLEKCFGSRWDMRLQAHVPQVRSSKLSTRVFANYMEWLVRFAAMEFDVVIPLPNECEPEAA